MVFIKRFPIYTLLLTAVLMTACTLSLGGRSRVQAPPAPTAIPLESRGNPIQGPDIIPPENPVHLPPGFAITVYQEGLRGPRMMTIGPDGHLYVAERGAKRIVRLPDRDGNGLPDGIEVVAEGLESPNSLDFYRDGSLYVGSVTRVDRLSQPDEQGRFQVQQAIIQDLPSSGPHTTRTVLFSPDWEKLYVSVGSSCNNCVEEDSRRAAILRYNPDGTGMQIYAAGLRNAVGITFRPGTQELWATNNGRDWLGDNQPPETVYVVEQGADYGWPFCHAGRIVDPELGQPDSCEGVVDPLVEMQAHSAPLGLAFYRGEAFPAEYHGDLFVAFHGSWNRSTPTGYKVVRIPIQEGRPGPVQDFAAGWLLDESSWGRPVDVVTGPHGGLFVSDDSGGKIYRIFYTGQ